MSKELPYFKFHPSEWLMGDITLENFDVQGVFINVVSYYWQRKCDVTLTWLKQRLNGAEAMLNRLIEQGLLKHDISTDRISVNFQNEQWIVLSELHTILSESGKKGAKARIKRGLSEAKARLKHKDKDKDKDKDITVSLEIFNDFRKLYRGDKRGNKTEFENFQKQNKDWEEILTLLKPAIEKQNKHRDILEERKKTDSKVFIADNKHLQTWINQRGWEIEPQILGKPNGEEKHTGYIVDPNKFYNRE